jgi:hypothetical protein
MVILGDSMGFLESIEWLEGLGAKDEGSCKIWGFFGDLSGILQHLEWYRT